jgi:hypothetical protein
MFSILHKMHMYRYLIGTPPQNNPKKEKKKKKERKGERE